MKRCEYCNSMNADDAVVCASCGASSFVFCCVNCGAEFKDGRICPSCGVPVGQKVKTCPRCQASYYTLACPACGYTPDRDPPQDVRESPVKRTTPLWILGWVLCFPIPLTVLIVRSKRLPLWAKIVLTALLWISLYVLGSRS